MNERIICLDIGDARIGVAVSDLTRLIATPIDTIYRVGWGPDTKKVVAICEKYETTEVLAGWPLNMDGTAGFQSEKVKNFCQQLEKAGLTVYYQDERLTTVTATNALIEGNMHRAERKHNVDKVAAAVILQQWLDTNRNAAKNNEQQEEKKMEENIIELIDGLRVFVQLWHGDDEFPPHLRCLWDENTHRYLRYETTWFATALLMTRIKENMPSAMEKKETPIRP